MAQLIFNEDDRDRIEGLVEEFDSERSIPEALRRSGDPADWDRYIKSSREELQTQVLMAALLGDIFEHLANPRVGQELGLDLGFEWAREDDVRKQVFYAVAERLSYFRISETAWEAVARLQESLGPEGTEELTRASNKACEAACRRALGVDRDLQTVAN